MPKILISYRRADSDAIAGRIRDRIAGHFGEDSVFMDIDSIPIGLDFRDQVKKALMSNDIVLAIIGPKWLGGGRGAAARIHEEADPVRMEIETALQRGIPVIPVLVSGATLPKSTELPDGLKDLSFRNAADVSTGRDFNQHIERLLRSVDSILDAKAGDETPSTDVRENLRGEMRDVTPAKGSGGAGATLRPGAGPAQGSLMTRLLVPIGLRFADPALETRFREYFRERFYWVMQMAMGAGIIGWVLFGPVDLWSPSGGVASTRFRFMFAAPLMVIFFGLSFTVLARRLWQPFVAVFAVFSVSCMTFGLILVTPEPWFRFEHGAMTYMIFLAFVGIAPFTTFYMIGLGLVVVAIYAFFLIGYGLGAIPFIIIFCSLMVANCYLIACLGAYARERIFRQEFAVRAAMERPGAQKVR